MNMPDALTFSEFSNLVHSVLPAPLSETGGGIAVAVSGGADSLALTLLLGQWCEANNIALTALTVDHGLRAEAKAEAVQVGQWLKEKRIRHVILNWQGDKPNSNIQEKARIARYQLMGEWCQENDVNKLFLAHHQGDQAETFLIRLFRGSGVDGLSAMKAKSDFPVPLTRSSTVSLCRPLLGVAKKRLEATLRQRDQHWIEDPGNQNENYMRVKVRKMLQDSDIEGLDTQRMAQTAARMARVQSLLQALTRDLMQEAVEIFPQGYTRVNLSRFLSAHEELALRCLSLLLKKNSGRRYVPRFSRVETLYKKLKQKDFSGQTLGGCLIAPARTVPEAATLLISREIAAIDDKCDFENRGGYLWDNRFEIDIPDGARHVKRLELAEWRVVCEYNPGLKKLKLPKKILYGLPCVILMSGEVILPNFIAGFEEKGFKAIFLAGYERSIL